MAERRHLDHIRAINRTVRKGVAFRHKDGGLYAFEEAGYLKSPHTGAWYIAIFYRAVDGDGAGVLNSTHLGRWNKSFDLATP